MMRAEFKKIGNWKPIEDMIMNLNRMMAQSRKQSLMLWALKAEATAKGHISSQDLPWTPLSPRTIRRKYHFNYPLEILVETSTYFQSITAWVKGNLYAKEMVALAGVRANRLYKTGRNTIDDVLIQDIARIQEYGSAWLGIPARPLWQPTFDEVMDWYIKNPSVRPDALFLAAVEAKYGMYIRRGGIGGKHINF